MKQAFTTNSSISWNGKVRNAVMQSALFLSLFLLLNGCSKNAGNEMVEPPTSNKTTAGNAVFNYAGLPQQTTWQLQQARAATAKYKNLDKALADGYIDINVIAPNMGYHYMRPVLVDGNFDYSQPEILVYNKDENGDMELVAVEYAVPLNLPRPSGFHGTADVWDGNTGFQLWLLHAWVWEYNPSGVFSPTNPAVHVH